MTTIAFLSAHRSLTARLTAGLVVAALFGTLLLLPAHDDATPGSDSNDDNVLSQLSDDFVGTPPVSPLGEPVLSAPLPAVPVSDATPRPPVVLIRVAQSRAPPRLPRSLLARHRVVAPLAVLRIMG